LLFKFFKRRPRQLRAQQGSTLNFYKSSLPQPEIPREEDIISENLLSEIDSIIHMPEGVDNEIWDRLCSFRRNKILSEARVRHAMMTSHEMNYLLTIKRSETDELARYLDTLLQLRHSLGEERLRRNLDLEVQFLLKQGQVEVECKDFIADYSKSILIIRTVVEDLNKTIKISGEKKVASMKEIMDFKKGIHLLEWEKNRSVMHMEDLQARARHIQMLKLTKDLQTFLNEEDYNGKQTKLMTSLENSFREQNKEHEKVTERLIAKEEKLKKTIRTKVNENKEIDRILQELLLSVSERKNIEQVNSKMRSSNNSQKRLKYVVQRRRLVDLAKAQAQEVAVLRAEVERLRMKTFPALVQLEH